MHELSSLEKPFIQKGPGDHIFESISEKDWSQEQLAYVLNISPKYVSEIINHKKPLTTELIIKFATVFNQDPSLLMEMDSNYRLRIAMDKQLIREQEDLQRKTTIVNLLPYHEFIKKGWVDKASSAFEMEQKLSKFYGVMNFSEVEQKIQAFQKKPSASLRQSEKLKKTAKENSVIAWLVTAKFLAKKNNLQNSYDEIKAKKILDNISSYTTDETQIDLFISHLNDAGIQFITLPHFQKTYLDGAAILNGNNRLIVYSARHDRLDNFWFTMAHELVHVIKHLNSENDYIADNLEDDFMKEDINEIEANKIASEKLLINDIVSFFENPKHKETYLEQKVLECSRELKIHKSVVVGMLAFYYNQQKSAYKPISYHHIHKFSGKVKPLIPEKYKQ